LAPIVARWTDWSGAGLEHLVLELGDDAIAADGVVLSGGEQLFAARYRVICDAGRRVRRAEVELIGDERRLQLSSDAQGSWRDGVGKPLPQLDGAIDVDLSISPFTNTLPIRRLDLESGQSADIVVAYIQIPEMTVTSDPQRYTCLERLGGRAPLQGSSYSPSEAMARARYRYESLDSDFVREIETDQDGLVLTYPGLFRRVTPPG